LRIVQYSTDTSLSPKPHPRKLSWDLTALSAQIGYTVPSKLHPKISQLFEGFTGSRLSASNLQAWEVLNYGYFLMIKPNNQIIKKMPVTFF